MSDYTHGETYAREPYARYETKQGRGSGAGYARWRSYEAREHRGGRKEDVYVPVHRLLAVVACYPEDMAVSEICAHLADKDVHHRSGVEWDNRPENLAVREHGRHSSITQAQMRAWAADGQRRREADGRGRLDEELCDRCGEPADVLAESAAWPGEHRCLDCATETAGDEPIEV